MQARQVRRRAAEIGACDTALLAGGAARLTGSGGVPPLARSLAGFGNHRVQQDDHRGRLAGHGTVNPAMATAIA
jgi:hypothetical protein